MKQQRNTELADKQIAEAFQKYPEGAKKAMVVMMAVANSINKARKAGVKKHVQARPQQVEQQQPQTPPPSEQT